MKQVKGFSKLSKDEKINWLTKNYFNDSSQAKQTLERYWNQDQKLQKLHDEFTENTISNYYLPFGIAPNFLINDELYTIPMAIEESSVVAAASNAAKFWLEKGGFKAEVLSTQKVGQVHFTSAANTEKLTAFFNEVQPKLIEEVKAITKNMEKRGGGISSIELRNKTADLENYYQLHCTFETLDAMGANFINSCLEQIAETFTREAENYFSAEEEPEVVMSILSNYVPQCLVRAEVNCPVEDLLPNKADAEKFAHKFVEAVKIAKIEPTGNDFRAIEACAHAYAAKDGSYSSLTDASVENGVFKFWMEIPLALGTVGGLTSLHPLVKLALEMLQKPSAKELMKIVAVAGLAQNFAALRSLTTVGIQQGHMKMHLMNILNQFQANENERQQVIEHFKSNTVSHSAVVEIIEGLRNGN